MKVRLAIAGLLVLIAVAGGVLLRSSARAGGGRSSDKEGEERGGQRRFDRAGTLGGVSPSNAASAPFPAPGPGLPVLDRRKRDEIRARIWESFGQEPPDAAPPARPAYVLPEMPPWPDGPSDSGPGIEPKYIQQAVRDDFFPLARKCYSGLSERIPDAGGSVVLAFDIVGNKNIGGIVEQVDVLNKSTLRDPDFIECMRQSFLSVTFPPPEGGGMVTVEYPIIFEPGDDGD